VERAPAAPADGQVRVSHALHKRGLRSSPSRGRSIWRRHHLQSFAWRLPALEAPLARHPGRILTEAQVLALEKARQEKEAGGAIETAPPGYLGAPAISDGGTSKSRGRMYQQTFSATYSKVAMIKRYDRTHALVAADLLQDRVRPFLEEQPIPLRRVLTERGTESCGPRQPHAYQLYVALAVSVRANTGLTRNQQMGG